MNPTLQAADALALAVRNISLDDSWEYLTDKEQLTLCGVQAALAFYEAERAIDAAMAAQSKETP